MRSTALLEVNNNNNNRMMIDAQFLYKIVLVDSSGSRLALGRRGSDSVGLFGNNIII